MEPSSNSPFSPAIKEFLAQAAAISHLEEADSKNLLANEIDRIIIEKIRASKDSFSIEQLLEIRQSITAIGGDTSVLLDYLKE